MTHAGPEDREGAALSVAVIGTGLIGGSLGLALTRSGVHVTGYDLSDERLARAVEIGAVSASAGTPGAAAEGAAVVFVAVPVGNVADLAVAALDASDAIVTDVGSVKGPVVDAVEAARPDSASRFIGGHPMAGSEQEGVDGADADLFTGATWVLTPTARTKAEAFTTLRNLLLGIGAEVVAVTPEHHDQLVALVSHVPQLAASTLMDLATSQGDEHRTLLRLAAGGFRDMTRIASGHPGIWPDILTSNREAVLGALDAYLGALVAVRNLVSGGDREGILAMLERARTARRSLPVATAGEGGELIELRVPVPDRPGVIAEITTLAGRLGVNVSDLEIAHSIEGGGGVMVLVVPADGAAALESGLVGLGYRCSRTVIE